MAGSRKEYEMLFSLTAKLAGSFGSTFANASTHMTKLQDTMKKLNTTANNIKSFEKQQAAVEKSETKLADLRAQAEKLNDEFKSGKKSPEQYAAANDKLERQIETATKRLDEQKTSLDALKDKLKDAGVNTDKLAEENKRLTKTFEDLGKAQKNLDDIHAAQEANKAAISATKTELLKTTAVITGAGAAVYKAFITPAMELQTEMSNLQAITGASNEEIKEMSDGLRNISKVTGTPLMELAQNAKMVAEANGDMNLTMAQMKHGADLASATQSDMATTLDFVGSQMKTFNLAAEDTNKVVDSFAYVTTLANSTLKQLGDAYTNVGGSGAQAGMKIDDINALLIELSNAGLKGGAAGTSLNAVIRNLSTPTTKSAKALKELGVSLYDSTGASRDMFDIMADLENSFSGLTDAQRNNYQNVIFDSVAQKGWNTIAANGIDAAIELRNELGNSTEAFDGLGQAAGMAATQSSNMAGDTAKAKASWHDLSITIGEVFLPYAQTAVEYVTKIIDKVGAFAKENPEVIKQIGLVATGLAGLKVGSLVGTLGFQEMKGGVLKVTEILGMFKLKNAEAAAQALTGGGKFAKMGKEIGGYFGGIGKSVGGLGKSLSKFNFLDKIGGMFKGGISNVIKPFQTIGDKIGGLLSPGLQKVTGMFGKIGGAIAGGPIGKIGGIFKSLGGVVGSVASGPLSLLGKGFGGLFGKIMPIIAIASLLAALFVKLNGGDLSAFIKPLKQAFEDAKPILQEIAKQFSGLATKMLPMLMGAAVRLMPLLGQLVQGILPILLNVIEQLTPMIISIVESILPVLIRIMTQLLPVFTNLITSILPVVLKLVETLLPIITQLVTAIMPIIADVLKALLPIVGQLITTLADLLVPILNALMPIIQVLADLFSKVLGTAIEAIKPIIESVMTIFKGLIDFITGVFSGDWSKAWQGVKDVFGGIFSGIGELFKAPIRVVVSAINGVIGGLNKLKVPDWVPGLGGKGINIPLIPEFAKGAIRTPDTFIAGERGAELITNARNRTVFTALQTGKILKNAQAHNDGSKQAALKALMLENLNDRANRASQKASMLELSPRTATTTRNAPMEITFAPQITVNGGDGSPSDIAEAVRAAIEKAMPGLMAQIERRQFERGEKEGRTAYA